ncbi:MAG TPA: hypothetical protein VFT46_07145 [Holophagaceae bacterium]|nr:hypothetical protein [Holophagaceae bacterium]
MAQNQAPLLPMRPAAPSGALIGRALKGNRLWEGNKKILYDRIVPAVARVNAGQVDNLFLHDRATNPDLTNMLEAGRMGPNEEFIIMGVGIALNLSSTNTAASLEKYYQEARLRIGVGPDDIERFSLPLAFIPSPAAVWAGSGPDLRAQVPSGFYRLAGDQAIKLDKGNAFTVRIIQGPNAPQFAAGETVDLFVQLFGQYNQTVVRG